MTFPYICAYVYMYVCMCHYILLMTQIINSLIAASATASTSLLEHSFALVCINTLDGVASTVSEDSGNPFLPSSLALLEQVSLGFS